MTCFARFFFFFRLDFLREVSPGCDAVPSVGAAVSAVGDEDETLSAVFDSGALTFEETLFSAGLSDSS